MSSETTTAVPPPRYWMSDVPTACDCCGIGIHSIFVDGATRKGWANLHPTCHERIGVGLGVGKGQRYEKQDNGRWMKTGG